MGTEGNLSCTLSAAGKVDFVDRPFPQIEDPHDVLVQIAYTGICGSDVSSFQMGPTRIGKLTSSSGSLLAAWWHILLHD